MPSILEVISVWTVFFVRKLMKLTTLILAGIGLYWCVGLLADRAALREELIRLHVVAQSDASEDQAVKLQVRDAFVEKLQPLLEQIPTAEEAEAFLRERLPELEQLANTVLEKAGFSQKATVTLEPEAFPTRKYDTFTLPAGVYESLRVIIGDGAGQNWWCVVFPELCLPAASETVQTVAADSGFGDPLIGAITGKKEYRVRFFCLDCLGKLENIFMGL